MKGKIKKKIIKGLLLFCVAILPAVLAISGIAAVWSYVTGLVSGFFGIGNKSPSEIDTADISHYTLEELIKCADDEDIITDQHLKDMMIDRESYKKLLTAIYDFNNTKSSKVEKIQYKHTYTTKRLETIEEAASNKNNQNNKGPKILGVQNNATYTVSSKTVTVTDSTPLSSVTLDGKKRTIKSDKKTSVFTVSGYKQHTVIAKNKKGGTTTVKFTLSKSNTRSNTSMRRSPKESTDSEILTDEYELIGLRDHDIKLRGVKNNDYFTPQKKDDKKTADLIDGKSGIESSKEEVKTNTDGKKMKEITEVHVEYGYMDYTVNSQYLESAYRIDWQPVFAAVEQNFIYNYQNLVNGTVGQNTPASTVISAGSYVGAGKGSDVVEEARKYIGNKYVYGGTSLTNGTDCSGFVMRIYEKFGVSLPRTSQAQSKTGKLVSAMINESVMKPGDLVFFGDSANKVSHVAMYEGNGKVVHASNSKPYPEGGIKESDVHYNDEKVVCVRRVLSEEDLEEEKKDNKKTENKDDKNKKDSDSKNDNKNKDKSTSYKGADKVLVGGDNATKIWCYFKAKDLNDIAVSAIMGNFYAECGYNHEDGKGRTSGGIGLASWLYSGRWQNVLKRSGDPWSLLTQLDYAWDELTGEYPAVLNYISDPSHVLEYKSAAEPGSVWKFADGFEGCHATSSFDPSRVNHDIQDYDKRLAEAQRVLKFFGGKTGAITDGTFYSSGVTGKTDVGVVYNYPAQIGTYDKKTGLVSLSDEDIAVIMEDFAPQFTYINNLAEDGKEKYTFEECKELSDGVLHDDGGDKNTERGIKQYYMPDSTLQSVRLPYMDIAYSGNVPHSYTLNPTRWKNIMSRYAAYYDEKILKKLIELLPNGEDAINTYKYFAALANGKISIEQQQTSGITKATGTYAALKDVVPSINIPENAGGMSVPLYLQGDNRWGSIRFGGGNITTSGCSVTSIAMVASYLNNKAIYPSDVVSWSGPTKYYVEGQGASWSIFSDAANHFGLHCTMQTVNADAIRKALKQGKIVIASATGYGTTQEFTKHGHFIVLRGLDEKGNVLVNDPNDSSSKQHYLKAYPAEFIVSECTSNGNKKAMWTFYK